MPPKMMEAEGWAFVLPESLEMKCTDYNDKFSLEIEIPRSEDIWA